MPVLDVVPDEFRVAATALGESVASQLRLSWLDLVLALEGCEGMAGSDEVGATWGESYESAARSVSLAATDLLNSCSHVGALLDQTGVNYAQAESASVLAPAHGALPLKGRFGDDWCGSLDDVARAVAPGYAPPQGWSMLAHLIQRAWPDGHQDRLHRAAEAWRAAGGQVRGTLDDVVSAFHVVFGQEVPESEAAATVLDTIGDQVVTLSQAFDAIADACDGYAQHLDQAHHEIIGELRDFLIWTAGIETAGGLLSIVTLGISEALAQSGEAYEMYRTATAIRRLIELLLAAARGTSVAVDAAAARVELITVRLRPILDAHLQEVRIALAADRGEIEIGKLVPSKLSAGEAATTPTGAALGELEDAASIGPASETWGDPSTLRKHFDSHGRQFGAVSAEDYARMAAMFLRRAAREHLPKKIDYEERTLRFYDPATNTYASYRFDGTTRTFFKPKGKLKYWDKQRGVG